ncbi:hypothetical protein WJX77_010522 [Trebouxia sp. C0004]
MDVPSPHFNEYEQQVARQRALVRQRRLELEQASRCLFPTLVPVVEPKLCRPSQRKSALERAASAQAARVSRRLAKKPSPKYSEISPTPTSNGRATLSRLRTQRAMSTSGVPAMDDDTSLEEHVAGFFGFVKHTDGWTHKTFGQERATAVVKYCEEQWYVDVV